MKAGWFGGMVMLGLSVLCEGSGEQGWNYMWKANVELFATHFDIANRSKLNPNNQFALLANYDMQSQLRVDLSASNEIITISAKPRLGYKEVYWNSNNVRGRHIERDSDSYLQEGKIKIGSDTFSAAIKRELMLWGPSQFASPSNPFFKSNKVANPFIEPSARDFFEFSYEIGDRVSIQFIQNFDDGRDTPNYPEFEKISVLKLDFLGEQYSLSSIAGMRNEDVQIGVFGQITTSDATLIYGDLGIREASYAWVSNPSDNAISWSMGERAEAHSWVYDILVGTAYTFTNGSTLNLEYRHNTEGFNGEERENYLAGATAAMLDLTQSSEPMDAIAYLSQATNPYLRTQNRNYLYLQYFVRDVFPDVGGTFLYEYGLDDNASKAHLIANYYLSDRIRLSLNAIKNFGGSDKEYGQYIDSVAFIGLKYFF